MEYRKIKGEIKSPLRYPGGKTRAIPQILPLIHEHSEFREPFVGGGSVFLSVKQRAPPGVNFAINDINQDLYSFWVMARDRNSELVKTVRDIKKGARDGRALFHHYTRENTDPRDVLDKAVRFFVLNRITFSGTVDSGGYSELAFRKRFTDSSIDRVERLEAILEGVAITKNDYAEEIMKDGDGVFIFLDPPYLKAMKSRLYGKRGILHTSFDHERFATILRDCPHDWLLTLDDSDEIRGLFADFATIHEWELQYGMNNYKQGKADKGKELFITNF
ncbi:MAG: DNA adenine methylase [Promethearchaeota archaeon]